MVEELQVIGAGRVFVGIGELSPDWIGENEGGVGQSCNMMTSGDEIDNDDSAAFEMHICDEMRRDVT